MAKIPDLRSTEDIPQGPIAWLKGWLDDLRLWVQARDPQVTAVGDTLDKFTTRGELVKVGLLTRGSDGSYQGAAGSGSPGPTGPPGPVGPPGGTYTPDLTPPPTPTGLAVVGAISNIIITWTAPSYTQGQGNARTNIYGAIWLPGDAAPTFGDVRTKLITSAAGANTIVSYATNPDTRWCIWIKFLSIDGVESTSPAGGTNGVQATTGQDVRALLDVLTQAAYNSASPYSRISFRADQFYILPDADFVQESTPTGTTVGELWMKPSTNVIQRWNGSAWAAFDSSVPFLVQTNPTTINGVNIPAGVYMNSAYIYDLTASIARLGTAWIDTAMIADLSADKLTAGSINVGEFLQSTGFVSGTTGWRIQGNGAAEFPSASIRGLITAGQIDSRNLTIRDAAGTVLFGSGTNLAATYINPSAAWINSNISIGANGVLSGAGGGAVTIAGLDSSVLRAGNPITAGNISTYIAGAAIGYANIGSVDAGTISVGTMNAARITARTITTDRLVIGAVTGSLPNGGGGFPLFLVSNQVALPNQQVLLTLASPPTEGQTLTAYVPAYLEVVLRDAAFTGNNSNQQVTYSVGLSISYENTTTLVVTSVEVARFDASFRTYIERKDIIKLPCSMSGFLAAPAGCRIIQVGIGGTFVRFNESVQNGSTLLDPMLSATYNCTVNLSLSKV